MPKEKRGFFRLVVKSCGIAEEFCPRAQAIGSLDLSLLPPSAGREVLARITGEGRKAVCFPHVFIVRDKLDRWFETCGPPAICATKGPESEKIPVRESPDHSYE